MQYPQTNLICQICYPIDQQVYVILNNLINLFKKKKSQSLKSIMPKITESFYIEKYHKSFTKLLNFMFRQKVIAEKTNSTCQHYQIYAMVSNKTGLQIKELDFLGELTYEYQAKRQYQIELLLNQVKYFSKTIEKEIFLNSITTFVKKQDQNNLIKQQFTESNNDHKEQTEKQMSKKVQLQTAVGIFN